MLNNLNKLSRAVSYAYKEDAICPGIVISTLKNGSVYASVVRYGNDEGFRNGKKVVCKCTSSDIESAILVLSDIFLDYLGETTNPIEILRESRKK